MVTTIVRPDGIMSTTLSNQRSDLDTCLTERVVAMWSAVPDRLRYEATMKESDRNDPKGNKKVI
jgi:hypothetical protein